jgi:hypothetical protein
MLKIQNPRPKPRLHHAQKPSSELSRQGAIVSCQKQPSVCHGRPRPGSIHADLVLMRIPGLRPGDRYNTQIAPSAARLEPNRLAPDNRQHDRSTPLNTRRPTAGALILDEDRFPGQTRSRTADQPSAPGSPSPDNRQQWTNPHTNSDTRAQRRTRT